ncbi:MAG: DUF4136 domain-containing protein [Myxococcota bacterium]
MSLVAMFSFALLGSASPSEAARVQHDVDRSADFSEVRTYAWHPEAMRDADLSPLTYKRLTDAVNAQLVARGLVRVDEDADVWLSVEAGQNRGYRVSGAGFGFGYGRFGRFGGFGGFAPYSASVVPVDETQIAVDLWDADTTDPLWRGSIRTTLSDRPEQTARRVDRGVRKIFRRFPIDGT